MKQNVSLTEKLKIPATFLFREAWSQYSKHSNNNRKALIEVWRADSESILPAWKEIMKSALSSTTWLLLCLLIERQTERREKWLKPGGFFYTKHGNRRKGDQGYISQIFHKLRPRPTINEQDRIRQAENLYSLSLEQNEPFQNGDLTIAILALAGNICGGPSKRVGFGLITGWRKLPKDRIEQLWNIYGEFDD